jgi:hypothetical protein
MAAAPASYNPDEPSAISKRFGSPGILAACTIALAVFVLHIYYNHWYGYFRDEFDYLSCGDHLAWGYVDQPPLVPFLARIFRAIFGDSLPSIRLLPTLASSLLIVQTAAIARELGGRTFALILSAVAVFVAPQYLSNGSLLGTNCLEPLLWMGCAYFVILAIKRNEARYWLWFGIVAGIGLEEKYTIALFVLAIAIGLLLTDERRAFLSKWLWLGGLAAFLIFLPNLLWNWHNDWPFAQLMHNIRAEGRDVVLGPFSYFSQQMLLVNPFATPIWLAGLFALLLWPRLRPYRALGWSYLICYGALYALHGKNYYLAPIYPMLLAAGAVVIEAAFRHSAMVRPSLRWLKAAIIVAVVGSGLLLLPITIPVFSPEDFLAYMKRLPFKLPVMEHSHERATLPQWYADQFGWKEIENEAAVAWKQIPANERTGCAIFAQDYGQAGAIDFFGRADGLPQALSGDRSYFLWGPREYSGNCMIILDDTPEKLDKLFEHVEYVGTSADNPWALEKQLPVYICRGAKFGTLNDLWPRLKHWH